MFFYDMIVKLWLSGINFFLLIGMEGGLSCLKVEIKILS